jgi:tetratricopeptide (TPR) repeat protein
MDQQSQEPEGKRRRPSKRRIASFRVIAILMPFLALFLLELSLRVFHYGHELGLFMEYPGDQRFLVLNPHASKRYFSDPSLAPSGNSELFKKVKDKNTCRIFVLGESTTIGYPYFHNGSFHRWLQYRLMRTFPDRNFEIINLSMTAVNSYTVSGFAKELVNYEPDAVLIYCGQNEYYGAMGVGSTNTFSGSPAAIHLLLELRQLRLTQLLSSLRKKITGLFGNGNANAGTLMQQMAGDQRIAYGSKLYYRGIDQFRSNMEEALHLFNQHHIPVFVSNLVSNEKGLQPFVSIGTDSLRSPGFDKYYRLGMSAMGRNERPAAYGFFREANRDYGGHALCNYYMAQLSYEQGDYRQAEACFSKALDLDGLRFRAPSQLNVVITQLCNKYPNAHLVDTRAEFEFHSDHHIIGSELILEHVHPNLEGYALMSDAFYEALKKGGIIRTDKTKEMDLQQLEREMPITPVDSLAGAYKIARLKMNWPFRANRQADSFRTENGIEEYGEDARMQNPRSEEQKLARKLAFEHAPWMEVMEYLYDYYIGNNNLLQAKTVMEAKVLEQPAEPGYYERTGNICGKLNDFKDAAFYFKKAFDLSPSFEQARVLFVLYLNLDRPLDAMPYIDYAAGSRTDGRLNVVKRNTEEIIRLERELVKDTLNVGALNRIAGEYAGMGNKAGALKYLEKAKVARLMGDQQPAQYLK